MANLTVLINEKITLDGNDRGVLTTQTITNINNIDNYKSVILIIDGINKDISSSIFLTFLNLSIFLSLK